MMNALSGSPGMKIVEREIERGILEEFRAIDEIGGELHSQYSVSYIPSDTNDTGYHEIKVTVDGKNLKVRARPGYYVAPPAS